MLYRKYRPKNFNEVVGQEHIKKTLLGSLTSGHLGHAYLFTGPRGTGKTTVARIFAKCLNCANRSKDGNPCDKCDSCLGIDQNRSMDLIEIDAASNRGIDEIRNLKESAMVSAPSGKYKIFIIDEVHMLTKDAFNALLKILEEPPAHIVFILATTESHKILSTVLSRVQRFDFKRLSDNEIASKLKLVAKSENIKIDNGGLATIANAADGAMRDAEVLLEKLRSSMAKGQEVDEMTVAELLELVPNKYLTEFLQCMIEKRNRDAIAIVGKIYESGIDLDNFLKNLIEYMRNSLMAIISNDNGAMTVDPKLLVKFIRVFADARSELKNYPIPTLAVEMAILGQME